MKLLKDKWSLVTGASRGVGSHVSEGLAQLGSNVVLHSREPSHTRALAAKPQLLLLDEPAAGMNPQETQKLMEMIRWIRDELKLTILLIELDMSLVMGVCERIYVLDYGCIIAQGTPGEIRNNPRVIEAYLGEEVH